MAWADEQIGFGDEPFAGNVPRIANVSPGPGFNGIGAMQHVAFEIRDLPEIGEEHALARLEITLSFAGTTEQAYLFDWLNDAGPGFAPGFVGSILQKDKSTLLVSFRRARGWPASFALAITCTDLDGNSVQLGA